MSVSAALVAYRLKISIRHISPMIWRRLLVRSDLTLFWSAPGHPGRIWMGRLPSARLQSARTPLREYDLNIPWKHEVRLEDPPHDGEISGGHRPGQVVNAASGDPQFPRLPRQRQPV
jgi:hypothetical protein